MAGIIAIFGPGADQQMDLARTMLSRIQHRGPDFEGTFSDSGVVLGYVGRKTDPSSDVTALPYVDEKQHAAVTCDAEIYNSSELLCGDAPDADMSINSAKAIAKAVSNSGGTLEKKLEGPFSFVAYVNGHIHAGRDRLGSAPLYMGEREKLLVLSSELKTLTGLASHIREFPPGHVFSSPDTFRRYYALESGSDLREDVEPLCEELRALLGEAVRKRLDCGEEKKGCFLSGGIDSSVIAALVSEQLPNVDTFTVGMKHSEDVPFALMVAEHLGTSHHEYLYGIDEVLSVLSDVIYHLESFDAPLVRSSIANYIASREARKHVDTILIGEGGDENFGGYHHVKRLKNPEDQQQAFMRLFEGLHNNGFMRTDRMNWAHSLNVRAPFFDTAVVELSMSIHPRLKLYGEEQIEKWILRKAFAQYLPREVVFRPKKQFARGSGSDDLLTQYADNEISDEEFEREKEQYPDVPLRWKEELMYFRLFRQHFGDDPSTLATVGRWFE
jgi:asparagine synthase (glutamine-hydrolysing)